MTLTLWLVAVSAALLGGGLAAISRVPGRRMRGLAALVTAVGALLWLLGADVVVLGWLLIGGAVVLLPGLRQRSVSVVAGAARLSLLAALATLLFAALYRVALQTAWGGLPPVLAPAGAAVAAGQLLTVDVALLLGAGLLATVVLAVAREPRARTDRPEDRA